ncbi:MAG TPA: hypothetical protein VD994_19955 [Prosthecobacter sp.]|nr:hypothetical protein [Prosthecobacter sp.]
MSAQIELAKWLQMNRPDLCRDLDQQLSFAGGIRVLNQATGLHEAPTGDVAGICGRYLAALRAGHEAALGSEAGDGHMRCIKAWVPPSAAIEAATKAERDRILVKLETLRPTDQPYTRIEWRWEEKGARDLFAKIMKALGQEEKGGES